MKVSEQPIPMDPQAWSDVDLWMPSNKVSEDLFYFTLPVLLAMASIT